MSKTLKLNKKFLYKNGCLLTSLRKMFFCAKAFRSFVNEHDGVNGDVVIIYDPGDVFRTKYNTIALKPLGVVVYDQNGNPEVSTHSTVLTLCRGKQPIVCLPPSMVHFSPNARLQGVILKPTRTSKEGREYAPCVEIDNLSDDFIQTILNGIVTE